MYLWQFAKSFCLEMFTFHMYTGKKCFLCIITLYSIIVFLKKINKIITSFVYVHLDNRYFWLAQKLGREKSIHLFFSIQWKKAKLFLWISNTHEDKTTFAAIKMSMWKCEKKKKIKSSTNKWTNCAYKAVYIYIHIRIHMKNYNRWIKGAVIAVNKRQ